MKIIRKPAEVFILFAFVLLKLIVTPVCAENNYTHYTIACPFKTISDSLSADELLTLIDPDNLSEGEISRVFLTTGAAELPLFEGISVRTVKRGAGGFAAEMAEGKTCVVMPLDQADPSMKLLRLDDASFPWESGYSSETDRLATPAETSNFERSKASTLLLTGTTALTRTVAWKMAQNGATYPAEMIKPVFDGSDITHISNESSIWYLCPEPRLNNTAMQFCSGSDAIEVFDYLGVDVIELTGNHLRDFDWKPLAEMLDLFDRKGYRYYGAGRTPETADDPLFLEHNGNRFVFLGCNCAGPDHVYVTDELPGVHPCNFDELETEIRTYAEEGYLPIVTVQYYEIYSRKPSDIQKRDFSRLSEAGAVVLSGSQAHYAQTMVPGKDRFIHYGLGNLFFDQMDRPVPGTRQEFLDRYVFYDGRLLTVQLITALLYDYSQPNLMTPEERTQFLSEIFSAM